ncbi:hypothetical protein CR513_26557, partial [Mucuna pruriens]
MDIRPTYSCLLGRPWIHAARAIPSSLHQKVKFIVDEQLISVMGEKEMMVSTPFPTEYIEEDEEALETSFQALEMIETQPTKPKFGNYGKFRAKQSESEVAPKWVMLLQVDEDWSPY